MSEQPERPIRGGVVARGVTTDNPNLSRTVDPAVVRPHNPMAMEQLPNLFEGCPVCKGAKLVGNPDWATFWKEHADDWRTALATTAPDNPPLIDCPACLGSGHIFTGSGRYFARFVYHTLKILGVELKSPVPGLFEPGVQEDQYPPAPPADQGPE